MGGTYKSRNKLSKREQEDQFIKLAKAIATLRRPEEVAQFLRDILSEAETFMLARRLSIAELLIEGSTYELIRNSLKVSFNTIARVQLWLETYGEGYRIVISRVPKNSSQNEDYKNPFKKLKRKYPMYYWPQLLLEELVKKANKQERERILNIVNQVNDKTRLSRDLLSILKK